MPVSPADFALWARATGNKYPETAEEKLAAAPHAYEYAKNLGKTGQNPPANRVGGTILYHSPESVQNPSPNSVFDAPVTPDNDAPKVRGTVDRTLTSEQFVNQQEHEAQDSSRTRQIIDVVGKTALAAGTLAAGVALARNPSVQQAVSSAGTTLKQNAQDIGSRVSSFLGGFGGQQQTNSAVVRNSGDITPPTTGQQYQQQEIPGLTQFAQTTKTAQVNPLTQSEVISTSQTFKPTNQSEQLNLLSHTPDPWTGSYTASPYAAPGFESSSAQKRQAVESTLARNPITGPEREYTPRDYTGSYMLNEYDRKYQPSAELAAARRQAATEDLIAAQNARANAPTSVQPSIPGVNPTLYALRGQGNVDLSTGEILDATARGWQKTPNYTSTYEGTQLDIPFGKTSALAPISEQTSDLIPNASSTGELASVGERAANFLAQTTQGAVPTEPAAQVSAAPMRQRMSAQPVSPEHAKAYELVAAGAERGHKIPFERALSIVTNSDPGMELSYGEQQAYQYGSPVAIGSHQSFDPGGYQATGQTRTIRTGENPNQQAQDLLERYAEANVSGLTPAGRRSAGAERMRGLNAGASEQDERLFSAEANPRNVLSGPTGRNLRNMGALDPEALAEGREEFAPHTFQTAGTTDPEQLAKTRQRVESSYMVGKLNNLFGPETSSGVLHLKTDQGIKPIGTKTFQKTVGPIADDVFARAAAHYAKAQGVDLQVTMDPNTGLQRVAPEDFGTANSVLYGNENISKQVVNQMGTAFRQSLASKMNLNLSAQDPNTMHTLMGVARNTTTGNLALENFGRLAGRARTQGRVRTETSFVPAGIPTGKTASGLTPEDVSRTIQNIYATRHPNAHQQVQEFVASLQPRQ